MTFTLRQKILLIATTVLLLGIASVVATNAVFTAKEYRSALESRALAIGKSLALQLERLLQFGLDVKDISGFEEQCQEIVQTYSGIEVAMVVSDRGNTLFRSGNTTVSLDGHVIQAVTDGLERVVTHRSAGAIWHTAVLPVRDLHRDYVAAVLIAFPEQLIATELANIFWLELGVAIMVLLAGLAVLYAALSRYVTRPLTGLISSVVRLHESPIEAGLRTPVKSQDEVGQLGTAFNGLLDELQRTTVSKSKLQDTTEELQRLSSVLYEQKERLEVTLRSLADAVISVNKNAAVQFLNPPAEKLCGWALAEAENHPLQNVLNLFDAGTKEPLANPFEAAFFHGHTVFNRVDAELLRRDGTAVAIDYTASPMHGPEGNLTGGVLILRDVTNERQLAQRLSWEASHDSLTGLSNRQVFIDSLESLLLRAQGKCAQHIILFLDIDRFKAVNDLAGHSTGDDLLVLVATTLSESVRPTDTVARLGGDEFALLLDNCSLSRGQVIAQKILARIQRIEYEHQGSKHAISASIGIAAVDGQATSQDVLSIADFACHTAKCRGRNCAHSSCLDQHREISSNIHSALLGRLNTALTEDSFALFFQRVASLTENPDAADHFEVLLRLPGDNGVAGLPATFLPTAVRFGLMTDIDKWVIKKILVSYHKLLRQRGSTTMICSINLSGESLADPELVEFIWAQAEVHAIPPGTICFELQQTLALDQPEACNRFAQFCHARGFLLALDNFSAGDEDHSYLKACTPDFLKVDYRHLRANTDDPADAGKAAGILRLRQALGLQVIGMAVEQADAFEHLADLGISLAQGFAVHSPQPLFT